MQKWKMAVWLLLMVLLSPLAGCNNAGNPTAIQIRQTSVVRGDLNTTISGNGKVAAVTDARLSFGSGGQLTTLNVNEGDKVTKGIVLAKLDTTALEVALSQSQIAFDQSQLGPNTSRI